MLIQSNHLKESLEVASKHHIFDGLNQIYHSIPESICSGCTNCCMESVHASYVEFLNIYQYLEEHPLLKTTILPKLTQYYFLELIQKNACPFLNEKGRCMIYEVRPLTCRLFGHWRKKDFNENISAIQNENEATGLYFKEKFQLPIPKEVINYSIKYCDDFKTDKKITKKERLQMSDDLFELEIQFLMNGLLKEDLIGTNLITWFIYTIYNQDEASDLRLKIIKEYLAQGKSATLSKIS
ncbi:MAG: YkgJ family cysteine cluster protein [Clostridia bacterium]|nr:YkgJ family cysteine cluster protein [Clostridia bacterium]